MKKNILFLTLAVALLWNCGKKGPLVLEPQKLPQAVAGLELRQIGNEVELRWKLPALLADGRTPMAADQLRSVFIFHTAKPFAPGTFAKRSELLAKPKAGELGARPDGMASYAVTFKDKLIQDKEHSFALSYALGRTRAPLSAVQTITTRTPPAVIGDLKLDREGKVVVLSWGRPQLDSQGAPLPALAGYRVYRRIAPAAGETAAASPQAAPGSGAAGARADSGKAVAAFMALNASPVRGEYFEDSDTGRDGQYEYRVASLLAENIESAPSNTVKMMIQDTFPPDVPSNLVTFSAKDHVFLTWEAVRDRDLDHYIVYRRLATEEEFKVLDAAVAENLFRDRKVAKKKTYVYAVSAVDKKGNESEPCPAAEHTFE